MARLVGEDTEDGSVVGSLQEADYFDGELGRPAQPYSPNAWKGKFRELWPWRFLGPSGCRGYPNFARKLLRAYYGTYRPADSG